MSYEPTTWQAGDTITSSKLNKMEQGIAAGGQITIVHLIYDQTNNQFVTDKTWQEVHDALEQGMVCTILTGEMANMMTNANNAVIFGWMGGANEQSGIYYAWGVMGVENMHLSTTSNNDYLTYSLNNSQNNNNDDDDNNNGGGITVK